MHRFVIAGVLVAAAVPALAQSTAPVAPVVPQMMPRPMADRVMTRAEVDTKVREHFTRLDANRDGFVTIDEAAAMRGAHRMMGGGHHAMGKPGAAAAMRDPAAAFDRLDSNRDGMISRDEFAKGREVRMERRIVMKDGRSSGEPRGERMRIHRMGGGMPGGAMILKMADTDKDGRISLAEASAGSLQHFDMMDSNRDGRLTPEERRAARPMIIQMRKAS